MLVVDNTSNNSEDVNTPVGIITPLQGIKEILTIKIKMQFKRYWNTIGRYLHVHEIIENKDYHVCHGRAQKNL